ncbi:MAG: trypsin-like peptidase domain-containing protein [Saprospiraceae bacterium]
MKNFFSYVLAGMIGGAVVVGFSKMEDKNLIHPINQSPSATFVADKSLNAIVAAPFDFVKASKAATKVVVHIVAEESQAKANQRYGQRKRESPFDNFFEHDFFGQDFFQGLSNPKGERGSGSGVIVSKDGYIVTNNHVVGFADIIHVTLDDGRKVKARKIGADPTTDLAVIKIDIDGNLPVLDFANSDNVKVGEWVLAVGNPFSYLTSTVTAGIVSAIGRDLDLINEDKSIEEFIQTDAVVNPGNSGGALVDVKGNIVGINTAIATPTGVYAGYSFAIPSNLVKRIVADIIENGNIERVNLGVLGYDVNNTLKKELDLKANSGFYVDTIDKGSAAMFAGILPGDIIVNIDGSSISKFDDIVKHMKYNKVGDKVAISVLRQGKKKKIEVILRKRKV